MRPQYGQYGEVKRSAGTESCLRKDRLVREFPVKSRSCVDLENHLRRGMVACCMTAEPFSCKVIIKFSVRLTC